MMEMNQSYVPAAVAPREGTEDNPLGLHHWQEANSSYHYIYDYGEAYLDILHLYGDLNMSGSGLAGLDQYMDILNDTANFLPPPLSWTMRYVLLVAFIAIILLSVAGNSLVIIVVARHKKMQTVTNAFLLSLAVSDLLIAAVNMPIQLKWYLDNEWTFSEGMCKFSRYLQGVVIVVSILTLTGIAADRYYAICHPLRARYVHTIERAAMLIVVFWVAGFLMVLPQVFIQKLHHFLVISDDGELGFAAACVELFSSSHWDVVYTLYFYFLLYLIPVVIMFIAYGCIINRLWKRQPIGETPDNPRDCGRRLEEKKRIVRMLVLIVLLFALSWFPFFTWHVYTLFNEYSPHNMPHRVAMAFFQLSGYTNCCTNPIIYCFMNDSFQKHFYRTVCCWRCLWVGASKKRRSSSTEMNGLTPMVSTNITNNSLV